MSQDTAAPAQLHATIYAGATFKRGWLRTVGESPDDYTGCTAIAELRDVASNELLLTFKTGAGQEGRIYFVKNRLELFAGETLTKSLPPFERAICHVELRRPDGNVERLYEISFTYSEERTLADPPEITP